MNFYPANTIEPGEYYRLRHDAKWDGSIPEDRLFLVLNHEYQTIEIMGVFPQSANERQQVRKWDMTEEEFFDVFEYNQEASDKRKRLIEDLVMQAHDPISMNDQIMTELQRLHETSPHALLEAPDGDSSASSGKEANQSTEVATAPQKTALAKRDQMAQIRTLVNKKRSEIIERNKRMQLAIKEKSALMEAKVAKLRKVVDSMEYMIHAMNVYLGIGEDVEIICEGERAPKEEKVVVRQLVLYADEECAMYPEFGGIDLSHFSKFVNWLREDWSRVETMLPEQKCVVALKMRRKDKYYTDNPLVNAAMNKGNRESWFLIRNGHCLYYVWPEFNVSDLLFPTQAQLDKIYMEENLMDSFDRPIRPGDSRWIEAVDRAHIERKQMMVGILFLQGLVDRTDLLHPFADDAQPNLADHDDHDRYIRYLRDGENVLDDGRLDWDDYVRKINSRLRVGCRVVGSWFEYRKENRCQGGYENEYPEKNQIYTVHREDAHGVFIKFAVDYWSRTKRRYAERNVSWRIYREDSCVLNIDEATEEDLLYYLSNRKDRHCYISMFPLIKTALATLREERLAEIPFRDLLAAEVAKAYDKKSYWDADAMEKALAHDSQVMDDMINWWKFKNKTRRAIAHDDAKALRMLVEQWGRWIRRHRDLQDVTNQAAVVKMVHRLYPDAMYVGMADSDQVIAFVPVYHDRDVWYYQRFFHVRSGKERTSQAKIMDQPWLFTAYPEIYSNTRWSRWDKWERGEYILSDEDHAFFKTWGEENLARIADKHCGGHIPYKQQKRGREYSNRCMRLIAIGQTGAKSKIEYWIQDFTCDLALDGKTSMPNIACVTVEWTRNMRTKKISVGDTISYSNYDVEPGKEVWRNRSMYKKNQRTFFFDEDMESQWIEEYALWKSSGRERYHTAEYRMTDLIRSYINDANKAWLSAYRNVLRDRYMERAMGDATQCAQWVEEKMSRINSDPRLNSVYEALATIAYRDLDDESEDIETHLAAQKNLLDAIKGVHTLREVFDLAGIELSDRLSHIDDFPFWDHPIEWKDRSDFVLLPKHTSSKS